MIDPMSIAVVIPTYDGKLESTTALGMMYLSAHKRYAMPYILAYCSNVVQARNRCVHWFMTKTEYEHLVFVDADIGFSIGDWDMLLEGPEDAVCCEYRKKDQTNRIRVLWGLGFARVSRRVFKALDALPAPDEERDMLQRFRMEGEEWVDYFPQGVVTGDTWRGEDHGFWLMVQLAGIAVRVERRTKLLHTGVAHWRYNSDDFPDPLSPFAGDAGPNEPGAPIPDPVDGIC